MRTSRTLLVTVGAVLAAGVLVAPAQAAPLTAATLYRSAYTHAYENGCAASEPVVSTQRTVPATGRVVTDSGASTATVNRTGGPVSIVSLEGTASARLVARDGRFSTFDLSGRGRTTVTSPPGQTCTAAGVTQREVGFDVTFTRPVWLTARTGTGGGTGSWIDVRRNDDGTQPYSLNSDEGGGTSSATWYLRAGDYRIAAALTWSHHVAVGAPSGSTGGTGTVHLEAHASGSAFAPPSGAGRAYLVPGPAVSCASASLPTTFTTRGGRVKSATFLVNGVQKKVVRHPAAGRKVTLVGLPKFRRNDVAVRLVVDPPGAARTATVLVRRGYRACAPAF